MLGRLRILLLYLIVFCISFQVGLHFWPSYSFVNGARVDYLSPTLYLLDVLIVTFVILNLLQNLMNKRFRVIAWNDKGLRIPASLRMTFMVALLVLDLLLNIFIAKSSGAHIFGIVKLLEFTLFGFFIARSFQKKYIPNFVDALALSGIISSVLAIWQFFLQHSVGGLWYFLGERTFNSATIGISTVNINQQLLRPYAAFPHSNVLAFFLLMVIVFIFPRIKFEKTRGEKLFLSIAVSISIVGLILTFSRVAILLAICFFIYELFSKGKANRRLVLGTFGVLGLLVILGLVETFPEFLFRGFDFRSELLSQSLAIFQKCPYLGIGLNNFFAYQAPLIKTISPIVFQPVHNIFILSLLSLGLFGWWIFPYGFFAAVKSLAKKIQESRSKNHEVREFYRGILFLIVSIIIAGMFDHFFLTVEQGQIMFALILGLSFSKI